MIADLLWTAAELEPLPGRQRVAALVIAAGIALLVFELVRRRKLREEFSFVWIATSVVIAGLALDQDVLLTISRWVGAASPVSTLFCGALLFLLAITLQFSVRLSRLTHRQRTMAQRLALLEQELERMSKAPGTRPPPARERRTPAASGRDEVA